MIPRVVLVTRPTDLEALVARHGTRQMAAFFLASRGQAIEEIEERHHAVRGVVAAVAAAIPVRWRRATVDRADLSRFVFEPEDVVVAVGQDGLVPNVAKYLSGQLVIGVNPEPERFDGVLVKHRVEAAPDVIHSAVERRVTVEARTMVEVRLDDGQRLLALNELFAGHRTHQSARYRIATDGKEERQSSSGVVVATGTGSTGWAKSIVRGRAKKEVLPTPTEGALAWFVREAFPSRSTGASMVQGRLEGAPLVLTSEMNDGGVVFGDGIEDDRLAFGWGVRATIGVAAERLNLVA